MSCEKCEEAQERGTSVYPFRVGNSEIGYGTVLIVACHKHATLVMEKLRDNPS